MENEMKAKEKLMVEEAIRQLRYPDYRIPDHLKRVLQRIMGRKIAPYDRINWPTGLLAQSLLAYYRNNLNSEVSLVIKHALIKYYDRFIKSRQKIYYLDDALAGHALIDLYQITGETRYKELLDRLVKYLKEHPLDEEGSLPYRPEQGKQQGNTNAAHIYADGIGMICPFLCRYGQTYSDQGSISLAVRQMRNFCKNAIDSRTGLPYHGYEYKSRTRHGIIGWGRACGWLLTGMADSLIYMNKETAEYDEIKQNFRRLVDKVEAYQREDGFYPWQLPAKEGPYDTSATAMILYAIAQGLKHDILIGIHRSRMLRGRDALLAAVNEGKLDNCQAECGGFGVYPQKYGAYPWSLGPALALFSVDVRDISER